jgi:hypothetical protein
MEENKYEFCNTTDKHEAYMIAKIQFKKIINNLNQQKFKDDFEELFGMSVGGHNLFMKQGNKLKCGMLAHHVGDNTFTDIFFWNVTNFEPNMHEVRCFFEKFFAQTAEKGIKNMIIPMHKDRKKYESFKNYNKRFFFSDEEFYIEDLYLKNQYPTHYLLKVNYKNYYEQKQKSNIC